PTSIPTCHSSTPSPYPDPANIRIRTLSLHDALPILDQNSLLIHRKPTPEDISDAVHLNHRHRSDKSPMKIGHSSLTDNRNRPVQDRKSTRLNSSHVKISYAVFCLK